MKIQGNIVDILERKIYHGELIIENGEIKEINPKEGKGDHFILPGFVDAHVHIESSMLIPSEFARLAVAHGTVATVSDPHEIANVLGIEGVQFMIDNGKTVPFKFHFGAPSCVPATNFETAGAEIDVAGIETLMQNDDILYLAEMMNYPGVLFKDQTVISKLALAKKYHKPIDGHAPGLRGDDAKKYAAAGISTDHECFTFAEAEEKISYGMKILIREGSAAKNFDELIGLIEKYPDKIMFCSDDKHPDDLIRGHINQLVTRALKKGHDLFDVLNAACVNPVHHYNLKVGLLQKGDKADFILVENLENFEVLSTYIDGSCVFSKQTSHMPRVETRALNKFNIEKVDSNEFKIPASSQNINIIEAINGEIITKSSIQKALIKDGFTIADESRDILKISVVNRYSKQKPGLAFIKNFGIKKGAIASCVGHDSHNIIAVGSNDELLARAINLIIENKGGISAVNEQEDRVLPLPVAGIMSLEEGHKVAEHYSQIDQFVKNQLSSTLTAPFMTLSFMALLVIPQLKLSDKGLFDGQSFQFTSLFTD